MKKTWFILAILFSLYLIVSLSRSIWQLYKAGDQVFEVETVKQVEINRNLVLKKELEASKSGDFVERQARDKLNMSRPGEVALIVPDPTSPKLPSTSLGTSRGAGNEQENKIVVEETNWRKWIRLFE